MANFKLPDTQSFLAMTLVVSIVALVFMLAAIGKSDSDTFKILVGGLMGVGFSNVIGYYFTSSPGSKLKDETIHAMAATASGSPAAVTAAAERAAPAAAAVAAPPAADIAAPPAAEIAVEHALAERDAEHKP